MALGRQLTEAESTEVIHRLGETFHIPTQTWDERAYHPNPVYQQALFVESFSPPVIEAPPEKLVESGLAGLTGNGPDSTIYLLILYLARIEFADGWIENYLWITALHLLLEIKKPCFTNGAPPNRRSSSRSRTPIPSSSYPGSTKKTPLNSLSSPPLEESGSLAPKPLQPGQTARHLQTGSRSQRVLSWELLPIPILLASLDLDDR